jgi:hypothetical protein
MKAVEASLKRLQTDYIDLYQSHYYDENTPIEETMPAFDDLVRQGKVRYVGCSNYPAWRLMQSLWVSDKQGCTRYECLHRITAWCTPSSRNDGRGAGYKQGHRGRWQRFLITSTKSEAEVGSPERGAALLRWRWGCLNEWKTWARKKAAIDLQWLWLDARRSADHQPDLASLLELAGQPQSRDAPDPEKKVLTKPATGADHT